ncbi:class IV adenylate cyclase [Algiphilus sp.]|uniref:class IV adenylate cyclase n=1 Tax=Algiphilus sp. TaxID=1872431 RepID=UPI0032EF0642
MARNIEIKAWARDRASQARIAARLADGPSHTLQQEDTFFHVPRGRLKLREFGDGTGELIAYQRVDAFGPRSSSYVRTPTQAPDSLKAALAAALGIRAVVRKSRTVFVVAQTRIHLDDVAGLGQCIELEVVLQSGQSEAQGRMMAERLMSLLGIQPQDEIAKAYVDLLADRAPGNDAAPTD